MGRIASGPRLVGRISSGPRLAGRIRSEVRVSASFLKNASLVGRLGSGPRFVANRAAVVFTHDRLLLLAVSDCDGLFS